MSNEDRRQDIDINEGNYNEFIRGNYIQGDNINYIQVNNLPQPITGFPQNIPRSSTEKFIGRQEELIDIYQQLETRDIAHIEGMGGIGKTELAIVYSLINLHKNTYPGGICWINARERDIDSEIIKFAQIDLNLTVPKNLESPEDRIRWCWRHWREGRTLIILDDVKDFSNVRDYLPPRKSQFRILITTRLKTSNSLNLKVLLEQEALELLTQLVSSEQVRAEQEKARKLCQRLGYLPLALQLVGRYIKTRRISFDEELARLETKGLTHDSMKPSKNDPGWVVNIDQSVKAAFELTWDELSNSARDLGCQVSLFALAPIPWSLVESSSPERNREELEADRIELESFHLLQGEGNYQLHQLIQEFFRNKQEKLPTASEQKTNLCNAIAEIAREIRQINTLKDIARFTPYIPHLIETANLYLELVDDDDLSWLFTGLGRFYGGQGAYLQALPWYERCLSICQERLGGEHPEVATSLNNLAELYRKQGRYGEAEPLYLESLELRKKLLGREHPNLARSLNNLALLYKYQGRYREAEPLYLESLELRKKLLGREHPEVAISLNNLAALYRAQGRYGEAEPLYLEALELRKKLLGEEHPYIAVNLNGLATLYDNQGKYGEAELLYLEALELRKKLLGGEHPEVAISLNNLALFYDNQGRYEEAEPLYLQAIKIANKTLGEKHPNTIIFQNNYQKLINQKSPKLEDRIKNFFTKFLP